MLARPPVTRVDGDLITVRVELESATGDALAPLETTIGIDHADLLDPTAGPALPVLIALAVALGEDLTVEGPVAAPLAARVDGLARLLARWAERPSPTVQVEEAIGTGSRPSSPGGVGLFFSRGADSWSTLLDLVDPSSAAAVTHLLAVRHGGAAARPTDDALFDGHRAVATTLGLELVEITTSARTALDPVWPWVEAFGPALVAAGRVAGSGLGQLVLSGAYPAAGAFRDGADPELLEALSTDGSRVVLGNPDRDRIERLAHLSRDPLARSMLHVCWEGETARNCGRCRKCQLTMAGLLLVGDLDPEAGFDHGLDPALVRTFAIAPSVVPLVQPLVARLAPEHETLRRAWADALARSVGAEPAARWGDGGVPGLSGDSLATRVASGLRATTGQADAPTPGPLGWRPSAVALRPRFADHDRVRHLAGQAAERQRPWAVVEHHIRDEARDGAQAGLALRLHALHGPGVTYLPGILWDHEAPPVIEPPAVAALLRTVRARAWWRSEGDLEPLRVVEAIEQGCLPLQVMPDGAARALQALLPTRLSPCVVADSDLAALDLTPDGVAARLVPIVEHLLAGSAERDLLAGAHGG